MFGIRVSSIRTPRPLLFYVAVSQIILGSVEIFYLGQVSVCTGRN